MYTFLLDIHIYIYIFIYLSVVILDQGRSYSRWSVHSLALYRTLLTLWVLRRVAATDRLRSAELFQSRWSTTTATCEACAGMVLFPAIMLRSWDYLEHSDVLITIQFLNELMNAKQCGAVWSSKCEAGKCSHRAQEVKLVESSSRGRGCLRLESGGQEVEPARSSDREVKRPRR